MQSVLRSLSLLLLSRIYVVARINSAFSLLLNSVSLSVDRNLGCFQVQAIINRSAPNTSPRLCAETRVNNAWVNHREQTGVLYHKFRLNSVRNPNRSK